MALKPHETQRLLNLQTTLQRARGVFRKLAATDGKLTFDYRIVNNGGYIEAGFNLLTDGTAQARDGNAAIELGRGFDSEVILLPILQHLASVMEKWRQEIIALGGDAGDPIEIPKLRGNYIAVVGDMESGFKAYGPFSSHDAAAYWGCDKANEANGDCSYSVMELQAP